MNPWIALLLFIIVSLIAGLIGAHFDPGQWYALINKPTWTPPNWLFAPVWTGLYILMGIAAWLAWRPIGWRFAHNVFIVQLVFNAAWPWLFFGLHRTGWAIGELTVLWILVLVTLVGFWRIQRWAGVLMIPYLIWLSYAWALNYSIWHMNGGVLPI